MTADQDDYQADIRFGEWLRAQRVRAGLSLEDAAKRADLSVGRLKALEMGLSERGVTRVEATKLGAAYSVPLAELLEQASRG
jgi:transcriptional regulator with XRE-family HTH domain